MTDSRKTEFTTSFKEDSQSNGLRSYLISNEKSNFDSMISINLGSRNLISENVLWKNRPKVSSGIIKLPVKFSLSFQNQKQIEFQIQIGLIDRSSCRCRFQRIFLPVQVIKFTPAGAGSSTLEITKTNFVCSPPVRHPFPTQASKTSVWHQQLDARGIPAARSLV